MTPAITATSILINGVDSTISWAYSLDSEPIEAPSKYEFTAQFSISKRAMHRFFNRLLEQSIAFPQISRANALNWPRSSRRRRAIKAAESLYSKQYARVLLQAQKHLMGQS